MSAIVAKTAGGALPPCYLAQFLGAVSFNDLKSLMIDRALSAILRLQLRAAGQEGGAGTINP